MFQYAAGKRLAHTLGVDLKLDLSSFGNCNGNLHRNYELDVFKVEEKVASLKEIEELKFQKKTIGNFVSRFIFFNPQRFASTYVNRIGRETFDPGILSLSDKTYLEGYWQSEKYFVDISQIIRCEFQYKVEQDEKNKRLQNLITSSNAISLHIRRGDYVSDPVINKIHGICNQSYYVRTINTLVKRVKDPHFFIFSDDMEWVREKFATPFPHTLIENNLGKGYEDLRLMSKCQHHIIANSTFSWWAAWLNPNPNKIVLAPKRWFKEENYDDRDLIPNTWIRM